MLTRPDIISILHRALEPDARCRAAFLAGSDANGRTDDLSDVDLVLIVDGRDSAVDHAIALVERALLSLSPIAIRDRLPAPTWHGHEQVFYQLARAPEDLMVDAVFMRAGAHAGPPARLFEQERHGAPLVLFDKDGLVRPTPLGRADLERRIRARVEELRRRFPLIRHMPVKLARRGRTSDAVAFYHSHVLRPLVDMLRIIHCPVRYDFGLRYLREDLPAAECELIDRLCLLASLSDIASNVAEASRAFERSLAAFDARSPTPAT